MSEQTQQPFDRPRVGGCVSHALEIQFEVGGMAAAGQFVRLLVEDDFVDKPPRLWIGRGQPGDGGAGELLLHRLQQALEIPDCKDVVFHEQPEPVGAVDQCVDRVMNKPLACFPEVDDQVGRLPLRWIVAGSGAGRLGLDGRHGDRFLE